MVQSFLVIPDDSILAKPYGFLNKQYETQNKIEEVNKLDCVAENKSQTLAQLAIAWLLKYKRITTMLIGENKLEKFVDSLKLLENCLFEDSGY